MTVKSLKALVVSSALFVFPVAVLAALPAAPRPPLVVAAADQPMADGEIRKVDPAAKKLTIRHGELKNLDMPPMTMVFRVKDPAMLEAVKVGDKVRFRADKVNGALTVVEMEHVR